MAIHLQLALIYGIIHLLKRDGSKGIRSRGTNGTTNRSWETNGSDSDVKGTSQKGFDPEAQMERLIVPGKQMDRIRCGRDGPKSTGNTASQSERISDENHEYDDDGRGVQDNVARCQMDGLDGRSSRTRKQRVNSRRSGWAIRAVCFLPIGGLTANHLPVE